MDGNVRGFPKNVAKIADNTLPLTTKAMIAAKTK